MWILNSAGLARVGLADHADGRLHSTDEWSDALPRRATALADICIRRPVFAAMIILALVVVGAASYGRLGVDRFPSVDLPSVSVRTTLPGSSTEETTPFIQSAVTR